MAVRNIRYETDAILRKKSKLVDVEKDREKTLSLINDIFETIMIPQTNPKPKAANKRIAAGLFRR